MANGAKAVSGPLRRQANYIILLFLCIHAVLVLRAALPLPGKLHGPWPWRMFERHGPWERALRATGTIRSGERREIPLDRIFGYARGATHMYAYQQLDVLSDPTAERAHEVFAAFLARRASDLGFDLTAIDLSWIATHLDTGQIEEYPIGTFSVGTGR